MEGPTETPASPKEVLDGYGILESLQCMNGITVQNNLFNRVDSSVAGGAAHVTEVTELVTS